MTIEKKVGKEEEGTTQMWLSALTIARLKELTKSDDLTLTRSNIVAPAPQVTIAKGPLNPPANVAPISDLAARFRVHVGFENQKDQTGKKVIRFELLSHRFVVSIVLC